LCVLIFSIELTPAQLILRKLITLSDVTICLDKRNTVGRIDSYLVSIFVLYTFIFTPLKQIVYLILYFLGAHFVQVFISCSTELELQICEFY
jgi:hypothetical protein